MVSSLDGHQFQYPLLDTLLWVIGFCSGTGRRPIRKDELDRHVITGDDFWIQPTVNTALQDVLGIVGIVDGGIGGGTFEVFHTTITDKVKLA